jgi:multidrug efflux system membrane fusion protein
MKKPLMILAAALLAAACAKEKPKPVDDTVPVTVAQVEQKDVPIQIRAIGNVQPMSNVAVRALAGGQLLKVWFKEGDDVRRGQTLFTIDPAPYDAALQQAQANLQRDQAQLRNAEVQAQRYGELVKKDYVTKEEYDKLVAAAEAARAVVAADRAAAENARLQRSYCEIRSPLDGRTGSLMVHAGNLVKANDTAPLVVINQVEPVYVQFSVPEDNLALLRQREGAKVDAAPQQGGAPIASGTLSFIDNNVDTTTGTITLKATFPNRDRVLWPGQYVNVAITTDNRAGALIVPLRALQTSQKGGQYVYVVKGGQGVEMRNVSVYKTIDQDAIIDKGLNPGETVVTDGQLRLTPKSKIQIKS